MTSAHRRLRPIISRRSELVRLRKSLFEIIFGFTCLIFIEISSHWMEEWLTKNKKTLSWQDKKTRVLLKVKPYKTFLFYNHKLKSSLPQSVTEGGRTEQHKEGLNVSNRIQLTYVRTYLSRLETPAWCPRPPEIVLGSDRISTFCCLVKATFLRRKGSRSEFQIKAHTKEARRDAAKRKWLQWSVGRGLSMDGRVLGSESPLLLLLPS